MVSFCTVTVISNFTEMSQQTSRTAGYTLNTTINTHTRLPCKQGNINQTAVFYPQQHLQNYTHQKQIFPHTHSVGFKVLCKQNVCKLPPTKQETWVETWDTSSTNHFHPRLPSLFRTDSMVSCPAPFRLSISVCFLVFSFTGFSFWYCAVD